MEENLNFASSPMLKCRAMGTKATKINAKAKGPVTKIPLDPSLDKYSYQLDDLIHTLKIKSSP